MFLSNYIPHFLVDVGGSFRNSEAKTKKKKARIVDQTSFSCKRPNKLIPVTKETQQSTGNSAHPALEPDIIYYQALD